MHRRVFGTSEKLNVGENSRFWQSLDHMVAASRLIVDRPEGSPHPRHPSFVYPLNYGCLEGTHSTDGDGIDVWIGSLPDRRLTAIICTVDLDQQDAELKLLLGCTSQEAQTALNVHNTGNQAGMLIERPSAGGAAIHD
jgi:inorganic pyrophosphatase